MSEEQDEDEVDIFSLGLKPPPLPSGSGSGAGASMILNPSYISSSSASNSPNKLGGGGIYNRAGEEYSKSNTLNNSFNMSVQQQQQQQQYSNTIRSSNGSSSSYSNTNQDMTASALYKLYKAPQSPSKKLTSSIIKTEEPVTINQTMKILIVGNAKCGKSSIINQYASNSFEHEYKTTIGADFVRKDVLLKLQDNSKIGVRLQLWDIAGQDRFQKLTRAYFSKAKGVVIVCDVSRDGTIEAVRTWKKEIDAWADQSGVLGSLPVVLFANKADLLTNPQDAFKTGAIMERVCREQGFVDWFITSAKLGDSVEDGFNTLMLKIVDIDRKNNISSSDGTSKMKNDTIKLGAKSTKSNKRGGRNSFDGECC